MVCFKALDAYRMWGIVAGPEAVATCFNIEILTSEEPAQTCLHPWETQGSTSA